ncbi:MAG: serine hydrolase domain-containing protein [Pseudomonadota bacterium]
MDIPSAKTAAVAALVLVGCAAEPAIVPEEVVEASPLSSCQTDVFATDGDLEPTSAEKLSTLQRRLPDWLLQTDTPSATVAYISQGALQWSFVCGEMEDGKPATLRTRYNTASIAKPVVGEIALRLAAQNQITLDEPMVEHWLDPDIADDPRASELRPRLALSHQTGFANWRRMTDGKLAFQWDPGTRTGYSGEGVRYVTRFLEAKFDTPFEELADEVLFAPSGMDESSFVASPGFQDTIAWGRQADREWLEPAYNDEPLGAGSVWTTSSDYARFLVAILANEGVNPQQVSDRAAINRDEVSQWCGEGRTPLEACPDQMGFGISWYVYRYADHTLFAHSGSNLVDKSLALFVPETQSGFVTLTNGENGKDAISRIARVLYDNEDFYTLEGY